MREFDALDKLVAHVRTEALEPGFSQQVKERQNRQAATRLVDDDAWLRVIAAIIAFSQNAKSDAVSRTIAGGHLDRAFAGFDVARVARMSPSDIERRHWAQLSSLRFKRKLAAIITVAQSLQQLTRTGHAFGSLVASIPARLATEQDVARFWDHFAHVRALLKQSSMPFVSSSTSLLHLLLDRGYDCIKPDKIVCDVAAALRLAPDRPNENERVALVRMLQRYCIARSMRPAVLDFYLLCYGGQAWARQFTRSAPTPLPARWTPASVDSVLPPQKGHKTAAASDAIREPLEEWHDRLIQSEEVSLHLEGDPAYVEVTLCGPFVFRLVHRQKPQISINLNARAGAKAEFLRELRERELLEYLVPGKPGKGGPIRMPNSSTPYCQLLGYEIVADSDPEKVIRAIAYFRRLYGPK